MSLLTSQAAAGNYATRPPDERFASVHKLVDAAIEDKNLSAEKTYNLKDLEVVPTGTGPGGTAPTELALQSPKGRATFTHWAFSQLCRTLGAPASYIRELPPATAADCLNFGLKDSAAGTSANLLVRAANGHPEPIIRACTSESYGRLWDAELYGNVTKQIMDRDDRWTTPPTWTGEAAGAYRGDRDSFVVLVNGGSIVTDPSAAQSSGTPESGQTMYRGLLIRNSEVGAASVVIETILFRYICGNHMLWGAVADKQFKRRHFGSHVLRDTIREISRIAWNWTNASAARDEAIIRALIDHEVAHTKEAVIDELKSFGATKLQAEEAYRLCEQKENASPRSYWGTAQGLTRLSQEAGYQDERYQLDKLAGLVLARGAKLVRV